MAELSNEIAAGVAEFLKNMADAPKGPTPEAKEAAKKRAAIKAKAFKSARFAYYIVGRKGAYSKGKLYKHGELIKLPLNKEPGKDWKPATKDGVALAEAEEAARLRKAAAARGEGDDEDTGDDEPTVDAGTGAEDVAEDVEPDVAETAPTPPAKPGKGKAAKPGKGKRAADQDIE